MKKIALSLILIFVAMLICNAQETPLWLRNSAISPDGTTIAFTYKGNIFTIPVAGGFARQITSHSSYSTRPVWSPNNDKLAFASNREGNFDVFITNLKNGATTRLTSHSANEFPEAFLDNNTVLFSSYIQPVAENQQFPQTMFTQLYSVTEKAERPKLFSAHHMENLSKHGNLWLYTDRKGYEDPWRKHHTSSIARDIWVYDANAKSHKKLTSFNGENRNAVWAADGTTFYYLSEQSGSFNVWRSTVNGGTPVQITTFKDHPVRYLSIDKNDNLVFSFDGELYVMKKGEQPQKVNVQIISDDFEREFVPQTLTTGAQSIAVSPNGKEIAFIARGDVFVTSIEFATTRRITDTPGQERNVDFSPDGRSLIYSAERNGTWNVYKTDLVRDDDKFFIYARELKETQLTNTTTPSFQPLFSPDGKEIAYLENRSEIRVLNLATKQTRTIMDGKYNYSYSDGDQWFQWSPDGKWIVTDYIGIGGWNNKDVAIIKANGSGETIDLTESGYVDVGAKWVMDGRAILFFSDRAGFRSHGSWGAHRDAYIMFLTQDAHDEFRLTKEERAVKKETEKKPDDKKEEVKDPKKDIKTPATPPKVESTLVFDLDNRHQRIVRLVARFNTRISERFSRYAISFPSGENSG
jgi:Tol biopolymer transport system component